MKIEGIEYLLVNEEEFFNLPKGEGIYMFNNYHGKSYYLIRKEDIKSEQ